MAEIKVSPVAQQVPFDTSTNDFTSTDVQGAIEEIGASASPGFSWGRAGNSPTNTWLQNESVPSNVSGRLIFIANPQLFQIFVSNETVTTYTVTVYEHEGNELNLTAIDSITITAATGGSKLVELPLTFGRQLALRVTAGSVRNIVAGAVLKGSSV